jgi:hypothetical protein
MALNPVSTGFTEFPPLASAFLAGFGFSPYTFCQCSIYTPAAFQPNTKAHHRNARFVAPFAKCLRFSRIGQMAIIRLIEHLRSLRSPSHIARLVSTIIVDSIQAMTKWTEPHFLEKGFKPFENGRNSNTPSAITVIPVVARVRATRPHVTPRNIFRRARHTVRSLQPNHCRYQSTWVFAESETSKGEMQWR